LAVRLPAVVVEALDLKEGDEIEFQFLINSIAAVRGE
jgi:antitoxin component of MazEF toxin-antitoxin module